MTVGMSQMKFAHVPGLVGGRHRNFSALLQRELICLVHGRGRFQPPAHPDSASFIVADKARLRPTTRTLPILAKEDLVIAVAHSAKSWRISPVPTFGPAQT